MAYNKSKAKGASFEAKIAERFTKEFNKDFKRVPLSGALEWMKGDIICIEDTAWFPYTIECKHYENVDWNGLLTAKSSDIYSFWQQTLREAEVMKKKPLLIFRWNRSKDFVAYNDELQVPAYVAVNSFGYSFKISLLDDWLNTIKNETDLANR